MSSIKNDTVEVAGVTYLLTKRYILYMLPDGPLKESDDKTKSFKEWQECQIIKVKEEL